MIDNKKKHMSKRSILIICIVGMVVTIMTTFLIGYFAKDPVTVSSDVTVTVENGVCTPADNEFYFELNPTKGKSISTLTWGDFEKKQGFITTAVVRDESGEEIYCLSGESVSAQMLPMRLQEGKYTVELGFITTKEEYLSFIGEYDFNEVGKFDFEPIDGTYDMTYTISVRPQFSMPLILGIACGVIVSVFLVIILCIFVQNGEGLRAKYDERQLLARGRAFKAGFFTILIMTFVIMLPDIVEMDLPVDNVFLAEICAFSGMMVFLGVAIWEHAYYGLNEKWKNVMLIFVFIGISNLVIGIINICDNPINEDGILMGYKCLNLMCGFLFVFIGVLTGIRVMVDKREELPEEDDGSDDILPETMNYSNGGQQHEEP